MTKDRLIYLWRCYVDNTSNQFELEELESTLRDIHLEELTAEALDALYQTIPDREIIDMKDAQAKQDSFHAIIAKPQDKHLFFHLFKYGKVAAILLCLTTISYFLGVSTFRKQYAQTETNADILPGTNKATITTSDGKITSLSASKNVLIIEADRLKYSDGTSVDKAVNPVAGLQTVSTPPGGTYQIILPDKTKVWLNAGSSIQFSTALNTLPHREILLSGEAYFEVTKNKKHPFVITTKKQIVTVLGTHFNINSYADEPNSKTTLLEGCVQVSSLISANKQILKPGQEAIVSHTNIRVNEVDTDQAIAWKNGYFKFSNDDLPSIMRQIARWYDVELEGEHLLPQEVFSGRISRNKKLSQILHMIEASGQIQFKISGRRIIVLK